MRQPKKPKQNRRDFQTEKFEIERKIKPLEAQSRTQASYLKALKSSAQVIATGPAGTGKTYVAAHHAATQLRSGDISRIVLSRPIVPCGRSLGFFPGTLEEKFSPWLSPILSVLKDCLGVGAYEIAIKRGQIQMVPMEVMRGSSFSDAIVLVDEAQNLTCDEAKMLVTRIGEGSQLIVLGDVAQSDLHESSGLARLVYLAKSQCLPVPIIEFSLDDCVRSGICAMWLRAFA